MTSTKKLIIASITGLTLLSGGIALSANSDLEEPAITAKQAIDIALGTVPGVVYEVELEKEDDIVAWEVELVSTQDNFEYELLIDANSGAVIEQELDKDHNNWNLFGLINDDQNRNHQ